MRHSTPNPSPSVGKRHLSTKQVAGLLKSSKVQSQGRVCITDCFSQHLLLHLFLVFADPVSVFPFADPVSPFPFADLVSDFPFAEQVFVFPFADLLSLFPFADLVFVSLCRSGVPRAEAVRELGHCPDLGPQLHALLHSQADEEPAAGSRRGRLQQFLECGHSPW